MRYTVLTSRTFHNRITRYLGVLVGAALVATLGLPSAVQAQTTGRADDGDLRDGRMPSRWNPRLTLLRPDEPTATHWFSKSMGQRPGGNGGTDGSSQNG